MEGLIFGILQHDTKGLHQEWGICCNRIQVFFFILLKKETDWNERKTHKQTKPMLSLICKTIVEHLRGRSKNCGMGVCNG